MNQNAEPEPSDGEIRAESPEIQEYLVSGSLDFEMSFPGDSPEEAARQARAYWRGVSMTETLRDAPSGGVFEVVDQNGKVFKVDLNDLDGVNID